MSPDAIHELAERNADVLRLSTLFPSKHVNRYLSDDEGIERAIRWCRDHGITRVYIEAYRAEVVPPEHVLSHACERFTEAGFIVSGGMTPMNYGKHSNGWKPFSCYMAEETREQLKFMSRYAARFADVVMIDDFLASDCTCADCRRARGDRTWGEFKTDLLAELSRTHILEAGRKVNPEVEFIIKFPAWHEMYQERGYDVAVQSEVFSQTWVGTETRGVRPGEEAEVNDLGSRQEPQYRAWWLYRWLAGIGGQKCGGGWFDVFRASPTFYVEQARQTVLAGAPEMVLFNYGVMQEGERAYGAADVAALMEELPEQFELARLIHGKQPRGLLGWKPAGSTPGPDYNAQSLLGMAGFPVTASHEFDPDAPGYLFSYHALHEPHWWEAVEHALSADKPILVTPAFLATVRPLAEGNRLDYATLTEWALVLPDLTERDRWPAMEAMPTYARDALRDAACRALGVEFQAPMNVALYLFDDDLAVVESFREQEVPCTLGIRGWESADVVLAIRRDADVRCRQDGPRIELTLPPRTMVVLRRG